MLLNTLRAHDEAEDVTVHGRDLVARDLVGGHHEHGLGIAGDSCVRAREHQATVEDVAGQLSLRGRGRIAA
jgi:hypothetical protein